MGTIMIVDDASFMRAVLKKIVLQAGHEVIAEAANGDDAINQFEQSQPDLVLMDIIMPPGPKAKDGIEAVSYTHLRAHETDSYLVCRLLLEKKKTNIY